MTPGSDSGRTTLKKVRQLPAPSEQPPAVKLDESGRVLSLKQGGWELSYLEYQPATLLDLPRKFTISDGQRGFRVVIDSWTSLR